MKPIQLPDPSPCKGGSVGVLVLKTPIKAGFLAATKTAQEGGEPKQPAIPARVSLGLNAFLNELPNRSGVHRSDLPS